tara:strand:+ start:3462 stop:4280 length:819 start_codon:yes stop_codon:yes gene_type:complete
VILVVGEVSDHVTARILAALKKKAGVIHIDPLSIGTQVRIYRNQIDVFGYVFHTKEIKTTFNRLLTVCGEKLYCCSSWQNLVMGLDYEWANVVNRPQTVMGNFFKAAQLNVIRQFFDVPKTIVAANVSKTPRQTIVKSISSVRSIVGTGKQMGVRRISEPVIMQRRYYGVNIRLHIMDHFVYSCRINSDSVDYRYCKHARFENFSCPQWVISRAQAMRKAIGAIFVGIDFIITPSGQWVCLEVNLSPGFTYFDDKVQSSNILSGVCEWLVSQ